MRAHILDTVGAARDTTPGGSRTTVAARPIADNEETTRRLRAIDRVELSEGRPIDAGLYLENALGAHYCSGAIGTHYCSEHTHAIVGHLRKRPMCPSDAPLRITPYAPS